MPKALAPGWVAPVLALAGCESEPQHELIVPNVRDAFAESLATIVCDRAIGCCDSSGRQEPGDACFSNMRNDAYLFMLLADEEQVPLRFDEGAACLDRFRDASTCDATLLAESLPKVCPEVFGDIPAGPNPAGAACEHTYECAAPPDGDRACVATSGSGSSCVWFVPADAGEACATDPVVVRLCPDGMGCRPLTDGAIPTCEPVGGYGATCLATSSCGDGLLCSQDLDGTFSCADALGFDALCGERPDACGQFLFCEPTSDRCRVLPVAAACAIPECPDYALKKVCQ